MQFMVGDALRPNWRLGQYNLAITQHHRARAIDRKQDSDNLFTLNAPRQSPVIHWMDAWTTKKNK